jgi:signal transduction histidine kinase
LHGRNALRRDRVVLVGAALAGLLLIASYLPVLAPPLREQIKRNYSDIPLIVLCIVAFLAGTSRRAEGPERAFRRLVSVGLSAWLAVKLIDVQLPEHEVAPTILLLRSVLFLGLYLFIAVALELQPHIAGERRGFLRSQRLDAIGAVLLASGLFVYYAAIPSVYEPALFRTVVPALLPYLLLDGYVSLRLLWMRRRCESPRWRAIYGWLLLATLAWLVSDAVEILAWAGLLATATAEKLADLLWLFPFVGLVFAARVGEGVPDERPALALSVHARAPWHALLLAQAATLPALHLLHGLSGAPHESAEMARVACVLAVSGALGLLAWVYTRQVERTRDALEAQVLKRDADRAVAMSALMGGVAHEVRNPLFALSATLDALEARHGERWELRKYLETLRQQIDRVSELMAELMEYGMQSPPPDALVSLDATLETAVRQCQRFRDESQARIAGTVQSGLLCRGDARRLSLVFRHILENAVQHAPPGSEVKVEAKVVPRAGRPCVECVVSDAGPGFPTEHLGVIFEPFFTRRKGGSGLGLALARRIVQQHGGAIEAANRPEGGAVVTVTLPAA